MKNVEKEAVLCFVISGNKVLMINRNKPPFAGMWNAVGGKVEKDEIPSFAAKREIKEESGLSVDSVELLSSFTWNYDSEKGYAFVSYIKQENADSLFLNTEEGIVCFKDIDWVLNPENFGVIPDLRVFLRDIAKGVKHDYHLVYKDSELIEVIVK